MLRSLRALLPVLLLMRIQGRRLSRVVRRPRQALFAYWHFEGHQTSTCLDLVLSFCSAVFRHARCQVVQDGQHQTHKTLQYVHNLASWGSSLQCCVALSTTEFDYRISCLCAREVVWLKRSLSNMGVVMKQVHWFCDNEAAASLCKTHMMTRTLQTYMYVDVLAPANIHALHQSAFTEVLGVRAYV
jgi:hypothetical protein